MNKYKFRLAIGLTGTVSAIAILAADSIDSDSYCANHSALEYNQILPNNHPANRCSAETKQLNWGSWLTGNSDSNQFHFFDLFELLNRSHDHHIPHSDPVPAHYND